MLTGGIEGDAPGGIQTAPQAFTARLQWGLERCDVLWPGREARSRAVPFHPADLDGLWQPRTPGRELTASDRVGGGDMGGRKVSRKDERSWTVERNEGRVVEIFVYSLQSTEEVRAFSEAVYDVSIQTPEAILVVDLRPPVVFPEPVAKAVVELMVRANSVRKKTAILLSNEHAI